MLENWLMPQLNEETNDYIFQQDGSPAHYKDVWGYLNWNMPQRWIGHTGKEDGALMQWSPQSPDLIRATFSSGGLWRTLSLCLHSPLISRFLQPYHHCCGSGWPWYADVCGTRWTITWMSAVVPKVDTLSICEICKKTWRVALSSGVRTTMICWVVYLLRIF